MVTKGELPDGEMIVTDVRATRVQMVSAYAVLLTFLGDLLEPEGPKLHQG